MKKLMSLALAFTMLFSLTACGTSGDKDTTPTPTQETTTEPTKEAAATDAPTEEPTKTADVPAESVELQVVTTFAGNDGNAQNYKNSYKAWETETGNKVIDMSATADDSFKMRVTTDFETNSEPDVLFFFNGADANSFIEAGKVMSIEDIRAEYPDFASNMNDELIPASLVDGKDYAVPVNGFWEAMFVNTEVLAAAGVTMPGSDYTWEQFLADCEKIKAAGFSPIAAALSNVPHYWWEFGIFNHTGSTDHLTVPENVEADLGQKWTAGLNDIKTLYEAGYFPENTLSATDDETFAAFTDGKAAFLIDGSWKVNGIVQNCQDDPDDLTTLDKEKLAKFDVTFVPGTAARKASDLIGGLSMGYYITKKAWDDPAKRAAAVSFVSYMTSDEIVPLFAQHTASALKAAPAVDESLFNELQIKAMNMMAQCTSLTAAVQDLFNGECRASTFDGMPEIVAGNVTAEDALAEGLEIYHAQ